MATTTMQAFRRDLLPRADSFYLQELGRLTRPNRKGWAMGDCPFHKSKSQKSLSVNLQSGGYRCFGCGAHGDLVSFLMQRDGIPFIAAAKKLGAWDKNGTVHSVPAKKKRPNSSAGLLAEAVVNDPVKTPNQVRRIKLSLEIGMLVEIEAEVSGRLGPLLRGEAPAYKNEAEDRWGALATAFEDLRNCETAYMDMLGVEYLG